MAGNEQTLFRKKTIDKISSPEQLTDYLKVTSPQMWFLLAAIALILVAGLVLGSIESIETVKNAKAIVSDGQARIVAVDSSKIETGMPFRIDGQEFLIEEMETDEFGRTVGLAKVTLLDGTYDGKIVTETVKPIQYLFGNR